MTKVLVMTCPFGINRQSPPLILGYLNAVLKKANFKTFVVDLNFELYAADEKLYMKAFSESEVVTLQTTEEFNKVDSLLQDFNRIWINQIMDYDVYCFTVHRANLLYTISLIKKLKAQKKDAFVVVGGPVTNHDGELDAFPKGLVNIFVKTNNVDSIPNILLEHYKPKFKLFNKQKFETDKIVSAFVEKRDLDSRPFPDWEDFSIWGKPVRALPFIASEGCIRKCSFCNEIVYESKFSNRSGKSVAEEVIENFKKYKVDYFEQNDLECNGNLKELEAFCDTIIESGVKLNWSSYAILRKDMSDDLVKKMKDSGCHFLKLGLESGSNNVLKKMRKGLTKEIAAHNIKQLHSVGIGTFVNLIIGFPGETDEDFQETLDFLESIKDYITTINSVCECFITPGSEMETNPEKFGIKYSSDSDFWYTWTDSVGNNKDTRRQRFVKLIEFLKEKKIPYAGPDVVNNKNIFIENEEIET